MTLRFIIGFVTKMAQLKNDCYSSNFVSSECFATHTYTCNVHAKLMYHKRVWQEVLDELVIILISTCQNERSLETKCEDVLSSSFSRIHV